MKYIKGKTARGFDVLHFYDDYDEKCDMQRSSSAEKSRIWLGTHDPNPMIMASRTEQGGTGWVSYPMPEDVVINHRMHLNRLQSISLAFKLLKFGLFNKID